MPGLRERAGLQRAPKGGKEGSVLRSWAVKMDFQDLTAKLPLDLKWIQPEAFEGLESPCSMEENAHYNYSLVHPGQRVSKRQRVIFL